MKTVKIGRSKDNDIVLDDLSVSSEHAQLIIENDKIIIRDLNSTNGTFVNGKKVTEAEISKSDSISAAGINVNWQTYIAEPAGNVVKSVKVGRAPSNDFVVSNSEVSSSHARLFSTDKGQIYIEDNNSTNGTYVNGEKIKQKQLHPGDKVFLANTYELNWSSLFANGKTVISSHTVYNKKVETKVPEKKKAPVKTILIATIIMALIGMGLMMYKPVKSWFAPVDVNAMYKNSVVMIYHTYVYEVQVKEKPAWYITTGPEGNLVFYDEKTTSPIGITGTGFFISKSGEIITNRHVALPWEYEDNGQKKVEVLKAIKDFIKANYNANVSSVGDFEDIVEILSNVKVTGRTISLGVILNDSYISNINDMIQCVSLKQSTDPKIDVALMQTKSKTLPDKVTNYVELKEAIVDDSQLKNGDKLYLIGYPAGFSLASTNKGIMVNTQNGQITRESDGIDFGHNIPTIGGASGSPVFNEDGKLVGINYQGMVNTQGFNMAILAKHIVEIAK